MSLNNLTISFQDRFLQRGMISDLDEAIKLHWAALLLCPSGHSDQSVSLNNLAISLEDRFKQWDISSDLDEAFQLFLQLSHLSNVASQTDLTVAKSWVASAENFNHPSALPAYKTALKFLNQQVALLLSSLHHFNVIREAVSSFATDAFHAVFAMLARFSTPLDELSVSGDTGMVLAEEFKWLSFSLRNAFNQSEDQSPQIWQLNMQWDDIVSHICMLPSFLNFLLPPLHDTCLPY
ncbi:hypothetical protein BDR07DRAFT_1486578 [Suillus spraguei]|nr:hypothetical protein BDR07DRAFT_1486578 [Suillus spraguei]